jgi:2-methylcitrate dehydratase PrpD
MNHGAIDCALAIVSKHDINTEDIAEVIIYAPQSALETFVGQPFKVGAFPHASAIFNYQYNVANALLRKSVKPEHFSEQSICDPQIKTLINKIKLSELYGADILSAKVEVKMKDGRVFSEFTDAPKGDPAKNPMTKNDIIEKFWRNVEFSQTISHDNAKKLLNLIENLEELDNVNRLVKLLVV